MIAKRPAHISVILIGLVAALAFGSFLLVQTATENSVREALLEQQMSRQIDNVDSLSDAIAADIDSVVTRMQLMATEPVMQSGDFASEGATVILGRQYEEISKISQIEGFTILDADGKMVNTAIADQRQFIGTDLSRRDHFAAAKNALQPHVSAGYLGLTKKFAFAVSVPVVSRETGEFEGLLVARFVVPDFFERYERNLQISKVVAFDRNQAYISSTLPEFIGLEYWGERVQTATGANPQLNAAYKTLFSGKAASTLFISGVTHDERFVSASPVFYNGEQVMSVAITTPTAGIYSQVDDILLAQKLQTIAALAGIVGAISLLIYYLSRWNRDLDERVRQRTSELQRANEQLEANDKLQKEFVNVAAHELRTPIQPILGTAEILKDSLDGKDKLEVSRQEIELLARNALRLERLSFQLLEVARIEGGPLKLNLERVDVSEKIRNVIADAQSTLRKDIEIRFEEPQAPLTVCADRIRIFEVLSNLLGNAIKFTEHGSITISAEPSEDAKQVTVKISDTGPGIDPEIMPRLFTKFATKSDSGTGIGLYIAKSLIEAHGGRIWAENNPEGGATFSFSLPLEDRQSAEVGDVDFDLAVGGRQPGI